MGKLLGRQRRSDIRKPALPTIAASEPALSADNAKAVVTVTPSKRKVVLKCGTPRAERCRVVLVTGKEAKLDVPIRYGCDLYADCLCRE